MARSVARFTAADFTPGTVLEDNMLDAKSNNYLVAAVVMYGAAKLFEALDGVIFSMGHLLSGHTLKHLTAALAAWWLLRGLEARRPAAAEERT